MAGGLYLRLVFWCFDSRFGGSAFVVQSCVSYVRTGSAKQSCLSPGEIFLRPSLCLGEGPAQNSNNPAFKPLRSFRVVSLGAPLANLIISAGEAAEM